ncbi:MAG TPA: PEP-CTERM sorting domain-containing protein [Nitrospirales bacterium]|nr:PEP-CTERM sorting domain-containing protein [Nitrospirales bacterium]
MPNFIMTGGGTYGPSQSIPEPSAMLLLGIGGVLLGYLGRC